MSYRFKDTEPEDDLDIPDRSADNTDKIAYGNSCIAKGLAFLKAQPAYADIDKGRNIVHSMETYVEEIPDKLSHVRVPRIKRQIRELVATLSDLDPTSDFVSNNPALYESQANVLNKLHKAWHFGEEVDRSIRKALQYAATEGTGYLYMTWEKPLRAKTGRITLTPLGALGYIPFQQSLDNKIQHAEVGIVCTEIPVQRARRLYHLPSLQPSNTTASNLVKGGPWEMISNMVSVYFRGAGQNRKRNTELANTPTVNIYHLYIKDDSINDTGEPIKMGNFSKATGRPLDNFSYVVPSIGDPIPTGRMMPQYSDSGPSINPLTGDVMLTEETRPAEAADCMLYPNLRLIIMSPTDIIYDGPSMFWHGKIPIVQFKMDDWPWNFLGFSLVRDTWRLEESITARMRARDDAMMAKLNPALMVDSRMSEEFQNNFSPRIPGGRIVKPPNLMSDHPIEPVVPFGFYDVGSHIDAELQQDEQRLDHIMGMNEIDAMLRLKQLPQSDSIDKLMSASTSILTDIARNMESSIRELGELWKSMAMQYITVKDRYQLLGEDGLTPEDFDFDPGNMIPSHLPGEDTSKPSRATQTERAREHMDSFQFNVIPNSYTKITSITRKMLYLQLWRDKTYPLDPWTFSEVMEIPLGPPPVGAKNQLEKWVEWQKLIASMMPQDPEGGTGNEGRPPSGHKPPHFVNKGDRQVVAES